MSKSFLTSVLLVVFVLMAGFGLFMPMNGHAGHAAPCPFALGGAALCAAPLAHIEHWQTTFMAVLVETFVLLALAVAFFWRYDLFDPDVGRGKTSWSFVRASVRPSLLQELFSNGILHPKIF